MSDRPFNQPQPQMYVLDDLLRILDTTRHFEVLAMSLYSNILFKLIFKIVFC